MKITRSATILGAAVELADIREDMKELKAREKDLRDLLDVAMANADAMKAGPFIILKTWQTRKTLDKKGLIAEFGSDRIAEFEAETTFFKLEVRAA